MSVPVAIIADSPVKLARFRKLLGSQIPATFELLGNQRDRRQQKKTAVVAVDLRVVENLPALRDACSVFRKRIFVVDDRSRLMVAQALSFGASRVLFEPIAADALISALGNHDSGAIAVDDPDATQAAAAAGASAFASMFSSVMRDNAVDVAQIEKAGCEIAECVAEGGLTRWLDTVRAHHEGTYQHCLLVTGIAVDFGLSLGVSRADLQRVYSAAMFHDIGKARIPLAVLDKPGRLDAQERAMIETHSVQGYELLKAHPGLSPEALDAVRHHHEYLDGSGYPDGLSGPDISDMVRILTIADIFAALIEDRRYKAPMARDKAYEIICSMRGKLEGPLIGAFKSVALTR